MVFRRTNFPFLILASWDGEEFGLLGSTAWTDANADWISSSAVAYLNVDVGVSGSKFRVSATPSLNSAIRKVTTEVIDPNSGKKISDVRLNPAPRRSP